MPRQRRPGKKNRRRSGKPSSRGSSKSSSKASSRASGNSKRRKARPKSSGHKLIRYYKGDLKVKGALISKYTGPKTEANPDAETTYWLFPGRSKPSQKGIPYFNKPEVIDKFLGDKEVLANFMNVVANLLRRYGLNFNWAHACIKIVKPEKGRDLL
ncbi:hypothetical protein Ciccas_010648 [Cichlidogyrus casuarinus]|uniref:Uncharacterized protein n=1 Tax=Cichlidogyrus casuarinus TaxID=1844966 RepID=A0ABD2PVK2_9PLAT